MPDPSSPSPATSTVPPISAVLAPLTDRGRKLIYSFEGIDQPGYWPGGQSGVTLPIGYDLGYTTRAEFLHDWATELPAGIVARLLPCCGVRGGAAAVAAAKLRDIFISPVQAKKVFETITVPKYQAQMAATFPGVEQLPADAQSALLSLVVNRGPKLTGDHREQMMAVHNILADGVQTGDLQKIADQLRAMKAIWIGKKQDGLVKRREAEAQLVESCIPSVPSVPSVNV